MMNVVIGRGLKCMFLVFQKCQEMCEGKDLNNDCILFQRKPEIWDELLDKVKK